ncbi:MAG TPA: FMN-dependent NADH-azoreductase, partial [Firmicutes bacterium]|nr:FMN-dependent NADH-azoreductase [Bacillota bacterium]
DQFKEADVVIIAAPMWSLSFPAPLKEYLDCILQVGKTITFESHMPKGLLDDKERTVIYVQS